MSDDFKLILASVDTPRSPHLVRELANLFCLDEETAQDILESPPIILLDSLSLPVAGRIKQKTKKLASLGARLTITDNPLEEEILKVNWPELPEIVLQSQQEVENPQQSASAEAIETTSNSQESDLASEVPIVLNYNGEMNLFVCPCCNAAFQMQQVKSKDMESLKENLNIHSSKTPPMGIIQTFTKETEERETPPANFTKPEADEVSSASGIQLGQSQEIFVEDEVQSFENSPQTDQVAPSSSKEELEIVHEEVLPEEDPPLREDSEEVISLAAEEVVEFEVESEDATISFDAQTSTQPTSSILELEEDAVLDLATQAASEEESLDLEESQPSLPVEDPVIEITDVPPADFSEMEISFDSQADSQEEPLELTGDLDPLEEPEKLETTSSASSPQELETEQALQSSNAPSSLKEKSEEIDLDALSPMEEEELESEDDLEVLESDATFKAVDDSGDELLVNLDGLLPIYESEEEWVDPAKALQIIQEDKVENDPILSSQLSEPSDPAFEPLSKEEALQMMATLAPGKKSKSTTKSARSTALSKSKKSVKSAKSSRVSSPKKKEPPPSKLSSASPPSEEHTGPHGVVISRITGEEKKKKAAKLLAEIKQIPLKEAMKLTSQTIISVVKGVDKDYADSIFRKFKSVGISARVVTRRT
ncbi:MAG: hypothetical protein D6805_03610 [Planctomycetota bacterium]|nr:MAG: hypothetical protein D6805_03610 [Planctomycetota bacterium]